MNPVSKDALKPVPGVRALGKKEEKQTQKQSRLVVAESTLSSGENEHRMLV